MSFSFVFPLVGGSSGGGTVSSVGLSMPTDDFNIANSPVTGSDTIAVTYKSQIQNLIFGSPDGITGTPLFRYLVGSDLPSATTSVKGALPIATDAEALAGSITDKIIVPETLSYTFLNRQIGVITAINSAILATDTINGAFAKAQGQINAKQNTLTVGDITGSEFSITGGVGAVIGTGVSLSLAASGVTANTYGSSTVVPVVTVNSKGIITGVTTASIAFPPSSVTSVFGRSGAVTAQSGDYTFAQISSTPTTLAGYGITDAITTGGSGSVSDISITGLAGSGFLNLRYQSSVPIGLTNYGTLYADSIGNIGYKKNANAFTNSLSFSGTADRVYTFQDRSGTLADNFDLALKLDLSGGNANQDIDIGNFSLNAKHVKINGTGGAGHIGLKHQSANITASVSESSIGADSVGDPVWKNDGGAIDKLELQSNKTSTVIGNEASTSKYLTVKGVYDWAVGLFAPKASPTFTGTVTTPDIVVSNATGSTPAFFDAVDKLITTTAQLWGTWVQTWASKATPVDADTIGFHDSASTFVGVKSTLLNLWTTYFKVKADLLYLKSAGLTSNYLPYFNGTNLVNSTLQRGADFIATTTQVIAGKTLSGGNTSYNGRYNQNLHPDLYGVDTMQAAILNSTVKGLHLYNAGLFMPYIQTSGWLNRTTGIQKYHDGQDFGGGNNPSWNYSGPYPAGVYHAYVSLSNLTDTSEAYITVNDIGNITNIDVVKPSSNITFSIVSNKLNIAATGIVAIFKYIGESKTNSQLINQTYSSTGLAKYWTGSEGFGVGHSSQNASAIFQVDSTAKGSIPYPRMTNAQRTALTVGPTTYGLIVYCTDATEGLYIYKSTGWTFII